MQVNTNDGMKEAVEVPFAVDKEPWCIYRLPDGAEIRVRIIVTNIYQLVDSPDDYSIKSMNVVAVTPAGVGPKKH